MKKIFKIILIILFVLLLLTALQAAYVYTVNASFQITLTLVISTILLVGMILIANKYIFNKISILKTYTWITVLTFVILSMVIWNSISLTSIRPVVAEVDNISKATEIIKKYNIAYVKYDTDSQKYIIGTQFNYPEKWVDKLVIDIAKDYPNDNSINTFVGYPDKDNMKSCEKRIEKIIKRIESDGIISSKVKIVSQDSWTFDKIVANIDVYEGYDTEEIKSVINKLFGNKKTNEIKFNIIKQEPSKLSNIYRYRIETLYKAGKYKEALKLIEEAKTKMSDKDNQKYLTSSTECINKKIVLDKKIAQNPNNYKYYIERGILQHNDGGIFVFTACDNGFAAIDDFEKSLSFNIKDNKIKDSIYFYLGDLYSITNKEKALRNYLKISDKKYLTMKYYKFLERDGNNYFPKYWYSELYSSIYRCQFYLRQYENAYKTCNERLAIDTGYKYENDIKQRIKNKKFDLDLKMKNYKQAIIDAKGCNYFICKIITKIRK